MPGDSCKHQLAWAEGDQTVPVVGSTSLSWAGLGRDVIDPAEASLRLWEHAFRVAKSELDVDLQQFTAELQRAVASSDDKVAACDGEGSSSAWQTARLLQLVGEFLSLGDTAFQSSLPEVIKWLHHQRSSCSSNQAGLKSLYSRLLFMLSRCSRLLSSESDEQPGSRLRPFGSVGAGPRTSGASNAGARSGRLSLRLRQLLYGHSKTRLIRQSRCADYGLPPAAAAGNHAAESSRGIEQQQDEQPQHEGSSRRRGGENKARRKSASVSFRPSVDDKTFVADPQPSEHVMMEQRVMKRCNTMPVQQAEAMQQLLQQMDRLGHIAANGMSSSVTQHTGHWPMEKPPAAPDNDGLTAAHTPPPQQQQQLVLTSKGSYHRSMELLDFIAVQAAVYSDTVLHPQSLGGNHAHHEQTFSAPSVSPSAGAAGATGETTALEPGVAAAASFTAGLYASVAAECSQLGQETDNSIGGNKHRPSKHNKGWVKKQWSKLKSYAKAMKHSSKTALADEHTATGRPRKGTWVGDSVHPASAASVTQMDIGSSSKHGWLPRRFGSSKKWGSFIVQPCKALEVEGLARSSKSAVDVTAGPLSQMQRPSTVALQPAGELQQRDEPVTAATPTAAGQAADTGVANTGQQHTQQLSCEQEPTVGPLRAVSDPQQSAELAAEQQVAQHQHDATFILQHQMQQHHEHLLHSLGRPQQQQSLHAALPAAAAAATKECPKSWDHHQLGVSPTKPAGAAAAAGLVTTSAFGEHGRLYWSAPSSRSGSLDGGSRLGQLHAPRRAAAAASAAVAAARLLAPRAGHVQPMRLHISRSSSHLSVEACITPAAGCAVDSIRQPSLFLSCASHAAPRRSSSGLGGSRHGSSRLGTKGAAEPSRMLQQQQSQAEVSPGFCSSLQQLLQQQQQIQAQVSPGYSATLRQLMHQQVSPVHPVMQAVTMGNCWTDVTRAGDAACRAAAQQQPLQSADCSALGPKTDRPAAAAAGLASPGFARSSTPSTIGEHCSTRSSSPATAFSSYALSASIRQLPFSRCQSVGGGLANAADTADGGYHSSLGSSSSRAGTPFLDPLYAGTGSLHTRPVAANPGPPVGHLPGHRVCYYSDSGAVHDRSPVTVGPLVTAGRVALQARTIKCAICANEVLAIATKSHNDLCGMLTAELSKLKGGASTADARLTVLANWMEDQLLHCVWPAALSGTVQQIIDVARLVVSLQPDGTGNPEARCVSAIQQVDFLVAQWHAQMQALTVTESNAEVLAEGVADCDIVVTLCLHSSKQMQDKLKWLAEPLPGITNHHASGAVTPRSLPVMQVSDFEMICPISRGAYGRVYKVKKKSTGDTFAIKVLTKTELVKKNMVESVTNERNILAMANNPFVVRFYYSFSSPEKLFLVMEYCPGGDLSSLLQHLGCFDEDTARQYIAETVLALEYCHSKGIIHRDLKPDNLLVSSTGHIKLSDFGLSKFGGAAAAGGAAAVAAVGGSPSKQHCGSSTVEDSSDPVHTGNTTSAEKSPHIAEVVPQQAGSGQEADALLTRRSAAAGALQQQQQLMTTADQVDNRFGVRHTPSTGSVAQTEAVSAIGQLDTSCSIISGPKSHGLHRQQRDIRAEAGTAAAAAAAAWLSKGRSSSESQGSSSCMSPATQVARACQLTRMIPHTSLPASPAVFGGGLVPAGADGSSDAAAAGGGGTGAKLLWASLAAAPAPMLQQLASDLTGEQGEWANTEPDAANSARPGQRVTWQRQLGGTCSLEVGERSRQERDSAGAGPVGVKSAGVPINHEQRNDPAAAITAKLAESGQVWQQQLPEQVVRMCSWQQQLKQQQWQQGTKDCVSAADSQHTMSAPVNAVQLQQRLQAVSDQQQQQQQGLESWPRMVPDSHTSTAADVSDDAVAVSISITAAEQHLQQQLQQGLQVGLHSSSSSSLIGTSKATSRLSLQQSLSVTIPAALQTPEDAAETPSDADGNHGPDPDRQHTAQQQATQPLQLQSQHRQQLKQSTKEACVQQQKAQQPGSSDEQQSKHGSQLTQRALGTPDYLAPERLIGMSYGPEVDWWALGVILYEFVYGAPPFNADTPQEIFERILDCHVEFFLDEDGEHVVSEECRDLIRQLLQGDPERRLGHRGAGEIKMHPWFQGVEWETLARQKAAFVPLDNADTKDYFVEKPFSKMSIAADLQPLQSVHVEALEDPLAAARVQHISSPAVTAESSAHQPGQGRTAASSSNRSAVASPPFDACPAAVHCLAYAAGSITDSRGTTHATSPGSCMHQVAQAATAGGQQHACQPRVHSPNITPRSASRSASGVATPGTTAPIAPAFAAFAGGSGSGSLSCGTPRTPAANSSSCRHWQQHCAAAHAAGLPPAAFTTPIGVAALTGEAATGVPPASAVGGQQQRSPRFSASQIESGDWRQQQQQQQQRWSIRQLGSPETWQQQQQVLQHTAATPQHKSNGSPREVTRLSGRCIMPASETAGKAAAGLVEGSTYTGPESAAASTWGSLYSTPGSSWGGAGTACMSPAAAAAAMAAACQQQRQQLGSDSAATSPCATSTASSVTSSSPESADGDTLVIPLQHQHVQPPLAMSIQIPDDWQQQVEQQQRKPRKSTCSSPQQRLKHQWAQQRLLQRLQQQQHAVAGTQQQQQPDQHNGESDQHSDHSAALNAAGSAVSSIGCHNRTFSSSDDVVEGLSDAADRNSSSHPLAAKVRSSGCRDDGSSLLQQDLLLTARLSDDTGLDNNSSCWRQSPMQVQSHRNRAASRAMQQGMAVRGTSASAGAEQDESSFQQQQHEEEQEACSELGSPSSHSLAASSDDLHSEANSRCPVSFSYWQIEDQHPYGTAGAAVTAMHSICHQVQQSQNSPMHLYTFLHKPSSCCSGAQGLTATSDVSNASGCSAAAPQAGSVADSPKRPGSSSSSGASLMAGLPLQQPEEAADEFGDFVAVNVGALQELNIEKQQAEFLDPIQQAVSAADCSVDPPAGGGEGLTATAAVQPCTPGMQAAEAEAHYHQIMLAQYAAAAAAGCLTATTTFDPGCPTVGLDTATAATAAACEHEMQYHQQQQDLWLQQQQQHSCDHLYAASCQQGLSPSAAAAAAHAVDAATGQVVLLDGDIQWSEYLCTTSVHEQSPAGVQLHWQQQLDRDPPADSYSSYASEPLPASSSCPGITAAAAGGGGAHGEQLSSMHNAAAAAAAAGGAQSTHAADIQTAAEQAASSGTASRLIKASLSASQLDQLALVQQQQQVDSATWGCCCPQQQIPQALLYDSVLWHHNSGTCSPRHLQQQQRVDQLPRSYLVGTGYSEDGAAHPLLRSGGTSSSTGAWPTGLPAIPLSSVMPPLGRRSYGLGTASSSAAAAAPATTGKEFLAQLGAIATDGTRGYKYRASDSGHGPSSFLQRSVTASLPGTLSRVVGHRSTLGPG